ncbi:hypothetical protein H4R20_002226 [Coemansia guatemalensis]|uniref:Uncharacterized protein n=1 Tax=Coemansia guatemalensis TaxID=2761395 RepID=A0A9W8LUW4_9FUNG|nr:hypothetical protein H4R20_002226 [Coemansia guatemalensis]
MTETVSEISKATKRSTGIKAPVKKAVSSMQSRRRSTRLAAKTQSVPAAKDSTHEMSRSHAPQEDLARSFMERLDAISRKLSQLGIHKSEETANPSAIPIPIPNKQSESSDGGLSFDSTNTAVAPVYTVVESKEKDMCAQLFSPPETVPDRKKLQAAILEKPKVKIPIHHSTYTWLQTHVEEDILENVFSIVEKVGNVCPRLTPRIETALQVKVASDVTESMQQCVLDTFLMAVIGTAQEHLEMDSKVDRNANELSMTNAMCRPDYLLILNGLLVFKGEEKKHGDVRNIALELIDKMLPGSVGKNGKLEYLLGYATAGTRVLFECIYDDSKMSECSDILNLERVADRVTMIVILINVVRIASALYHAKH